MLYQVHYLVMCDIKMLERCWRFFALSWHSSVERHWDNRRWFICNRISSFWSVMVIMWLDQFLLKGNLWRRLWKIKWCQRHWKSRRGGYDPWLQFVLLQKIIVWSYVATYPTTLWHRDLNAGKTSSLSEELQIFLNTLKSSTSFSMFDHFEGHLKVGNI